MYKTRIFNCYMANKRKRSQIKVKLRERKIRKMSENNLFAQHLFDARHRQIINSPQFSRAPYVLSPISPSHSFSSDKHASRCYSAFAYTPFYLNKVEQQFFFLSLFIAISRDVNFHSILMQKASLSFPQIYFVKYFC